ncbi:GNAT family N-acetyltransferase [Solirhodobacter olei]|uniref:GNAT family N-acetyltransferase n=1 Tax=Solirhodobacter olei TaxID=2493082 RepID=UPI001F4EBA77|nr:GNAT family N-acetyltransferase [Solirhodobacter olei]
MLDWAAAEGWNPGLDDTEAFLAADPEGFFVADLESVPVAAISVVNHSPSMAFLGLYLCLPEFRHQGIGYGLWRYALTHAGGRTVGLDGVAAQEPNYEKSGFVRDGSTLRLEAPLAPRPDSRVRPSSTADGAAIAALDAVANGYTRAAFLEAWITPAATRRCVVLDEAKGPEGFAVIRLCQSGAKIGPIVAADAGRALVLARAAAALVPSERAIIDVPAQNAALLAQLHAIGFSKTFATARMYRGPAPQSGGLLQAIGTMELG